jgi:Lipase
MRFICFAALLAVANTLPVDNATDSCRWINDHASCPDPEIRFYLYTRDNVDERQLIHVDDSRESSNLSSSLFNPLHATKIIIHGFRADMFLAPLFDMKTGESVEQRWLHALERVFYAIDVDEPSQSSA